ncbi:hypothetical protein CsatB_027991 [Cannabis sativa]
MRDNNTALLVSKEGRFELGFFTPTTSSSKNRYLGIRYNNIRGDQTVVWVANRCEPIKDSSGSLTIDSTGNLVLFTRQNNKRKLVWSTNSSKQAQKPFVQLLDNGNLVLRDEKDANTTKYLWESFDYPTDTILPGMKLGWDLRRGLNRRLSSWKSSDDPCHGDFTYGIELDEPNHTYPQLFIRYGTTKFFREGPWNAISFSGTSNNKSISWHDSDYQFVHNNEEVYFSYNVKKISNISRIVLGERVLEYKEWLEEKQVWNSYYTLPGDQCDYYSTCGANSQCLLNEVHTMFCKCLEGFKPKNQENWNAMNWSEGCVRNSTSFASCDDDDDDHNKEKDLFLGFVNLKVPDSQYTWASKSVNLEECKAKCLTNCSCMAYSFTYSGLSEGPNGTDCVLWFGDLFDIRQPYYGGQHIYIRMPFPTIARSGGNGKFKVERAVIISAIFLLIGLSCGIILIGFYIRRRKRYFNAGDTLPKRNKSEDEDLEFPSFDQHTLSIATDNFSENNKLGEGGFGPVYKGTLEGGQEIAVKRLSMYSGQGANEFKNEIKLIAKLQHRNLVKIFGYCIHREMKLLIYEYMSNKSLDYFIFDEIHRRLLEWPKRFQIVCGIAKGLLYLHHDSRLRIIHRDLKASNVLLDEDMNPKISDFGLARTFGGDQIEENTKKVVGTYGYMAPEYASDGLFSIKSDVFSFGTLMLEIVSGKRSRGFYDENNGLNLIGLAWTLMKEGNEFKLIDKYLLKDPFDNMEEALRCIHIGLLCVQQKPVDRPNMSSVILMLSGEKVLPHPKPPAYFTISDLWDGERSSSTMPPSCNTSITVVDGR